eukprot:CAMPEP_0179252038 /NCGR_PEP_ID=MMETSP0797-20121207/22001_1 /TAXON_ID=47934 /ORGANISM="Dinophysis acuminata, Strain DAEP01" /LENGTH=369 /DNA_ID=CAMNT_0020959841 /DNA_START=48 /DNA_END=1152 /DNA_ORIENTATION=-
MSSQASSVQTPVKRRRVSVGGKAAAVLADAVDAEQQRMEDQFLDDIIRDLRADRKKILLVKAFLQSNMVIDDGDILKRGTDRFSAIPDKYLKIIIPRTLRMSVTEFANMPVRSKTDYRDMLLWMINKNMAFRLPRLELPVPQVLNIVTEMWEEFGNRFSDLSATAGPDWAFKHGECNFVQPVDGVVSKIMSKSLNLWAPLPFGATVPLRELQAWTIDKNFLIDDAVLVARTRGIYLPLADHFRDFGRPLEAAAAPAAVAVAPAGLPALGALPAVPVGALPAGVPVGLPDAAPALLPDAGVPVGALPAEPVAAPAGVPDGALPADPVAVQVFTGGAEPMGHVILPLILSLIDPAVMTPDCHWYFGLRLPT